MVKVFNVHPRNTFESPRVSRLMAIVKATLGPDGVPMNARGEHIVVGLSVCAATMDIYYNKNQIDVYGPDWEDTGRAVAVAFEKAGEKEWTVRKNYDSALYRR